MHRACRTRCKDQFCNCRFLVLADWVVEQKLAKNEYIDNPDFPDKPDLRVYYMYDTTEWNNKSENINENKLSGGTTHLDGEAASKLAAQMQASALNGPVAFKPPVLKLNLGTEGFGKNDGGVPTPPSRPRAKPKAKADPKPKDGFAVYFNCLQKVLEEMPLLKTYINKCNGHKDQTEISPFVTLLTTAYTAITVAYSNLREETTKTDPGPAKDCRRNQNIGIRFGSAMTSLSEPGQSTLHTTQGCV